MTDPHSVFAPGDRVAGRFRVVRFLARGGMGELYEAEDEELRERVALKTVLPAVAADERARQLFKREVHLARQVTHPNVCRIFDVFRHHPEGSEGTARDLMVLAMELLHGGTLADCLRERRRLPTSEVLPLLRQMAAGLEAAHRAGVVHRDFKTSNVMLVAPPAPEPGLRAVITDFGLARRSSEEDGSSASMSEAGSIAGTPAYMAPEQVDGGALTPATDIYALGVVLFEMVTGSRPFVAENPLQAALKRLQEPAPTPRVHVPDLDRRWEAAILRCLERDPQDRFQAATEVVAAIEGGPVARRAARGWSRHWLVAGGALGLVIAAFGLGAWRARSRRPPALTATDTVVLADFANSTGDAVFDDTMKQALAASLQQSPFLSIVPDRTVQDTLKLMGRPAAERLTVEVAQEVCQRTESAAFFAGSISTLGSDYVIGVNAVACRTGDSMARDQVQAAKKEDVLDALGRLATRLRGRVGESLGSLQKYDTPLAQTTTPSLEALKAYSMGARTLAEAGSMAAIPLYLRAIELDPGFAMAYAGLGIAYNNMGESALGVVNFRKAFDLRERVSERERLRVSASYYSYVTGEVEKANQTYALWMQAYPRDWVPHHNLGINYESLGQYEKALPETLEAVRLNPSSGISHAQLLLKYCLLGRLEEAKAAYRSALERKLDYPHLHFNRYGVAFLEGDAEEMRRQADWAEGQPGVEDVSFSHRSDTEAFSGRLRNATALTRRAVDSARRAGKKETAAQWQANGALRQAEFGNPALARTEAAAAQALAPTRNVLPLVALALARAGDPQGARKIADQLEQENPLNTRTMRYWLPVIRAAIALQERRSAPAIDALQSAAPHELGVSSPVIAVGATLYPVYVRGLAYLALRDGKAAASEFEKFVDRRAVVVNYPLGALARLGLARAYALQGDAVRSRAAYDEFFTLWKDADPDVPILREARAESARLK